MDYSYEVRKIFEIFLKTTEIHFGVTTYKAVDPLLCYTCSTTVEPTSFVGSS